MPKGNKTSNFPANQKPKMLPGEMGQAIEHFDKLRHLKPVKKGEPELVRERVDEYFRYCAESDEKPSVEGLSLALGVSRQAMWTWQQETNCEAGRIIERAKSLINALLTDCAMNSKINPIVCIWLQRNHFGYEEHKTLEIVSPTNGRIPDQTRAELIDSEPFDIPELPDYDEQL